jgi:hypothetical protein
MSVYRPFSKADFIDAVTRRLFQLMCTHSIIGLFILLVQYLFRNFPSMLILLLLNLNLLLLAERSWRVQCLTMHLWHPVVQTFFCVTRMVHGALVILSVVLWGKLAQLVVVG